MTRSIKRRCRGAVRVKQPLATEPLVAFVAAGPRTQLGLSASWSSSTIRDDDSPWGVVSCRHWHRHTQWFALGLAFHKLRDHSGFRAGMGVARSLCGPGCCKTNSRYAAVGNRRKWLRITFLCAMWRSVAVGKTKQEMLSEAAEELSGYWRKPTINSEESGFWGLWLRNPQADAAGNSQMTHREFPTRHCAS
jgi:hypothetical protein